MPELGTLAWWALAIAVTGALLVTPLAPALGEDLRVSVCRSTGGSCGYVAPRASCDVLSRDTGIASAVTPLRVSRAAEGSGADEVTTAKALDGTATVTLHDPAALDLGAIAAERLGVRASVGGRARGLDAVFRFSRHDDADAWLDHYHRLDAPISSAAAGWSAPAPAVDARPGEVPDGLHEGVRRLLGALGFADLDAVRSPDGVVVAVPSQAQGDAVYARASSSSSGDAVRAATPTRLTLDGDGRSTTTGELPAAANQDELARALPQLVGLAGPATYSVASDAAGDPVRLELRGLAAVDADGAYVAASRLPRLREEGRSRSSHPDGAIQTVVLDLRSSANREAFDRAFRVAGPAAVVRSLAVAVSPNAGTVAPDAARQAAVMRLLAERIADDAVYVRTTVATRGSETTLLEGFSEDFAVPASRLAAMPGCAQ